MAEEGKPRRGAPIVALTFIHGPNVVDIGDLRVARGKARREHSVCNHLSLVYDTSERRVWCTDCESDVESFDAFMGLVKQQDSIQKRIEHYTEIAERTVISRAAQVLDKAFRSRSMVPCCPHCSQAIFPEDVLGGLAQKSKAMEQRRRGLGANGNSAKS